MNFCVAITDSDFCEQLSRRNVDEISFWSPGRKEVSHLEENEMMLFKLHYPDNCIVGGGFFVGFTLLPPFLAWEAFREKNGVRSLEEMEARMEKYRRRNRMEGPPCLGCTILTEPFWFREEDWLVLPDWKKTTVRGRRYSTDQPDGRRIWEQVRERLPRAISSQPREVVAGERYTEVTTRHRLGQGGFRVTVTDVYGRRCAITGEKTLPVLEAAHIVPYAREGPHLASNGLLLRSDFHRLYDNGYLTVTPELRVEVSRHLREDFGNGREYERFHGQALQSLPQKPGHGRIRSFWSGTMSTCSADSGGRRFSGRNGE